MILWRQRSLPALKLMKMRAQPSPWRERLVVSAGKPAAVLASMAKGGLRRPLKRFRTKS